MSEYKLVPDEQQRIIMDLRAAIERKDAEIARLVIALREARERQT